MTKADIVAGENCGVLTRVCDHFCNYGQSIRCEGSKNSLNSIHVSWLQMASFGAYLQIRHELLTLRY